MSKVLDSIKEEREKMKSRAFSRDSFNSLLADYMNDADYESLSVKTVNGEACLVSSQPVKKFRKIIKNILEEYGVDKKDSETILDKYKFKRKDVDEMYEFISEFIYLYLSTGRNLNLFAKEEAVASIKLEDVKEFEKDYPIYKKNDKTEKFEKVGVSHIKAENHKKLRTTSSTPKWKKSKLINNKLEKVMEMVTKDL